MDEIVTENNKRFLVMSHALLFPLEEGMKLSNIAEFKRY